MFWRRAKSEGRPGGFGPHVHVFPPWESTMARPEGSCPRCTLRKQPPVCVCVCPDQDVTLVHVCFVGWHIKRTVSEDRRHETKHSHRGPVWELPWYVGNAVCYDPLLMNVYQCCFSVSSRGDGHLSTIRETAGLLWKTRLWIFADSVHWTVWA